MSKQYIKNLRQQLRRKQNGNLWTHTYEKTPNGFLMRTYRNMKSRVSGIQKRNQHLYRGKYLLEKNRFYQWSKDNQKFGELFLEWEQSNYKRSLSPSINRIDSSRGYELDNIEWLTVSENSRLGGLKRRKKNA